VTSPDFVRVYRPAANGSARTLLLLHGTGGDERDLLPLAERLDPSAGVLSPRGKVLEHGMPRFFRRLAEGVFDTEDVRRRAGELAEFVKRSAAAHRLAAAHIVAVGFSNGANIASALLLLHPEVLGGAILFRAMVPLEPDAASALPKTPVFLSNGRQDPLVPVAETERLAALLKNAGADVTLAWQPSGHQLTAGDLDQATAWLAGLRV
jgi:phospholipase/carboxylesterase